MRLEAERLVARVEVPDSRDAIVAACDDNAAIRRKGRGGDGSDVAAQDSRGIRRVEPPDAGCAIVRHRHESIAGRRHTDAANLIRVLPERDDATYTWLVKIGHLYQPAVAGRGHEIPAVWRKGGRPNQVLMFCLAKIL